MADISTNASIVLTVNGKQARNMLSTLQKDASRLEQRILAASKAGDKATMAKLQRELRTTNNAISQLQGTAASVEQTLSRLDKAAPKELNKTLKTLQGQLKNIERGTPAWDAHIAKIKAVRAELQKVNQEMQPDASWWDSMNDWLNNCQTALLAIGAAVTGLVMAGKSAVQAYADMEQEMANVRKFTGMDAGQVEQLNEEFKKIDTRTAREDLNKLAQEAGRLGKSSQEDVLGFVRSADKINVALDDLGEGATLTLSKLTGIFGDEKRLGTEKALLSVGSVINELSQNCAASAPYIAEFASRMGGVGSQAGMTVQQIMGFAAVLDSNNQKLEASATALSQVMVRIYQDPAKYARVAGIDASKFSKLVKEDMNSALILLLSTLKQAGNMDVLSPMFKEMGENGSRAISALSTLAGHISEVKAQQDVANTAFREAISIDREFEVQNNTVQAGLDKAKNRLNELAVELGQRLQPVMRFFISSSSMCLRVLSRIVTFIADYKSEIATTIVVITAYTVAVKAQAVATSLQSAATLAAAKGMALLRMAMSPLKGLFAVARLAVAGLTNSVQYLTRGLEVNYAMQQRWRAAWAGMGAAGWATAVVGVGVAVYGLYKHLKRANEEAHVTQTLHRKAMADAAEELEAVRRKIQFAQDERQALEDRLRLVDQLNAIIPDYAASIDRETGAYRASEEALKRYNDELVRKYEIEGAKEKLADIGKQKAEVAVELAERREQRAQPVTTPTSMGGGFSAGGAPTALFNTMNAAGNAARISQLEQKLKSLEAQERRITKAYGAEIVKSELKEGGGTASDEAEDAFGDGGTGSGSEGSSAAKDRFKAEEEWRTRELALNRIAYATGQKDYQAYCDSMDEVELEFIKRKQEHQDLSEAESAELEAQYQEQLVKQQERFYKLTQEEEDDRYSGDLAIQKQRYVDGLSSKEEYQNSVELSKLEHLRRLAEIAKRAPKGSAGSEGAVDNAQKAYNDALFADMEKRRKRVEDAAKKHEQRLADIKKSAFGDNPAERQAKYDADFALLQEVYQRELSAAGDNASERLRIEEAFLKARQALRKMYGLQAQETDRNSMQQAVASSVEWLNSDGGKAFTGAVSTLAAGMGSIFSGLSSLVQAELDIETAAIEKRYEREVSFAEGNSYQVKKLEKQKEKEIAKAKNEANRKMFAMQVIQAVAQTAQNAISAYGSAAAIPLVGYILAPIAAGMAVAAGMIQIAAIKKQQKASEAQGYASGGFTKKGHPSEVAGVVHAGEWVASQQLVNSPQARPLLEALDYAQRTNTVGSLRSADVSRAITAPIALNAALSPSQTTLSSLRPKIVVQQAAPQSYPERVEEIGDDVRSASSSTSTGKRFVEVLSRLEARLNEPFVTVNTVTGDAGIQKAQEDYRRLIQNKSPKYRR